MTKGQGMTLTMTAQSLCACVLGLLWGQICSAWAANSPKSELSSTFQAAGTAQHPEVQVSSLLRDLCFTEQAQEHSYQLNA